MEVLKWTVTAWNVFMVAFLYWPSRELTWKKNKAGIVGFALMMVMYILALVPIWR